MSSKQRDPRWTPRETGAPRPAPAPVELPVVLRLFRVHSHDRAPLDCTLHPDGRLTMTMGGQVLVSMLPLDDLLAATWADSRIEWDPEPLTKAVAPGPAVVADQPPLDLLVV